MKYRSLLIIAISALVFSGCTKQNNQVQNQTQNQQENQEMNQEQSFVGSLIDAVRLGKGMKCAYTIENVEYEGYVKGKNYRGKIKSAQGVGEVIMQNDCMWTWDNSTKQGIKACYDPTEAEKTMWGASDEEEVEDTQEDYVTPEINYECHAENLEDSIFNLPDDINFLDMAKMMENLPSAPGQ